MKELRKSFVYFGLVAIITGSMIILTFLGIVCYPQNVFETNYNSVIQENYNQLKETKEKKIIIIGGSSVAFGVKEELLEEKTGYKVISMGVHAGMGGLFNTEIAKANIQKDDIVLLGYEYGWGKETYFKNLGVNLVMSGIDSKIEMYRYIPLKNMDEIFGYLFQFAQKKIEWARSGPAQGTYSRSSFDENGNMILERPEFVIENYEDKIETYGEITNDSLIVSDKSVEYLKNIKEYVEKRGASCYFISPPLLKRAFHADESKLMEMVVEEENKIGIEYISDPTEYLFEDNLMFDTVYHCNTQGEQRRTELLAKDLEKYLN